MPAMTRSHLEGIRSLADAVLHAMANGSGRDLITRLPDFSSAVDEVNASLDEIDTMLADGLRDESLSMHDPELIRVSRLLDIRSRADWIQLYGWLLEHGQSPPSEINIDAAEQFDAATHDAEPFRNDLVCLRRLALERAPLKERLGVLRRLRKADPSQRVWFDSITSHEEARLRELRLLIPAALASGNIERISEFASELKTDTWDRPLPTDLYDLIAGALEAQDLARVATEAEEIETRIADFFATIGQATSQQIDVAISQRQRLLELAALSEQLVGVVSSHPRILELIRTNGLDRAVGQAIARAEPALDQLDKLEIVQKTKRDFMSACQQIEYLCDHPPEKGVESAWLADLQRCDFIARAACQELPDLMMPEFLRERLRRSAASVESREMLRRRFWVLTSVAVVGMLVVLMLTVAWILWRRTEYSQTVSTLRQRADEARLGMHLERPFAFEELATRYPSDPRVAGLIEEFDAGVQAEASRVTRYHARLADHAERLEELAADLAERRSGDADRWLDAWPESFSAATTALAEARQLGGLPEQRTTQSQEREAGNMSILSAAATARFQQEEDDLARAEAQQAELELTLSQLAQQAFDAQLSEIQDRLTVANEAKSYGILLTDVQVLRRLATSPRSTGSSATATSQRIPSDAVAVLDAIESRLKSLIRDSAVNRRESL